MADKPLQIVSGVPTEVEAKQTSAGAGDAGKVVALNASGKIDSTMIPAGFGSDTDAITASEAISAGQFVNLYDNGGTINMRLADANNARPAHGFVTAAVSSSASGTVYGISELNDQLSGLTVGAAYYLSETAGGVTDTAPSSSGAIVQPLGVAKSTTALRFLNQFYMKRA